MGFFYKGSIVRVVFNAGGQLLFVDDYMKGIREIKDLSEKAVKIKEILDEEKSRKEKEKEMKEREVARRALYWKEKKRREQKAREKEKEKQEKI